MSEREKEKEKIAHLGTGEDTVLRIASINWAARLSLKVLNERMRRSSHRSRREPDDTLASAASDSAVSLFIRVHLAVVVMHCLSLPRHRVTISALCHRSTGGSLFWFASQAALWQPPPFPAAAEVEFGGVGGLHWKEVSKDEQKEREKERERCSLPSALLIQTLHF